ncbi:hypothetical protein F5Y11DRAFT_349343 [Daldinia sp. FL1419]|nr:hypothetical protein F5Y11DRAFT_349343 [Daldinia sp. FL1419]
MSEEGSADGSLTLIKPLGVPYMTYIVTTWVLVIVSGITLAIRLVSRFRGPHRLYWDDTLIIFSWILSLIVGAVWQWAAKDMYYTRSVQAGQVVYDLNTFWPRMKNWLTASLIAEMFFYTSLFFIKLSFLLFFRRLGRRGINKHFKYIWWIVLIFTCGSYIASIGNIPYKCLVGTVEQISTVCQQQHEIEFSAVTLKANAAFDVTTDFMVMVLPTILVWNIQMAWSKKCALIGLFWLSIITMVVAIVRAIMASSTRQPDGQPDVSWLWFWTAIEPSVAIMVCCGSAFPQLFTASVRSSRKPFSSSSGPYHRTISRIRTSRKRKHDGDNSTWIDLTAVSRNGTSDFDSHSYTLAVHSNHSREIDPGIGDGNMVFRTDGPKGDPMLVPRHAGPIPGVHSWAVGASSENTTPTPENQITRQYEFEVR